MRAAAQASATDDGTGASDSGELLVWTCPICLDALEKPVLTTCCGQSFCDACLDAALAKTDACPMCREPLLSGRHSVTRNRALEELLARLPESVRGGRSGGGGSRRAVTADEWVSVSVRSDSEVEHQVLIQVDDPSGGGDLDTDERRQRGSAWRAIVAKALAQLRESLQWRRLRARCCCCVHPVQLRQWWHWCRVHWSSLQCVFYVALFFVFVFFLRVQEEEFADHQPQH